MSALCPNCFKEETEGTLFCPYCGTKMYMENGAFTAIVQPTKSISDSTIHNKSSISQSDLPQIDGLISLQISETGQILPLIGRDEFSIGRISKGQSILPDVDLSLFNAYSKGVSRLHASIRIQNGKVIIQDLGSSNGTKVNQKSIKLKEERILKNGDHIKLGKFKIQVLINEAYK